MKILLIDAFSSQHVGNAALVDSTLAQLRIQFPQAEYTILSFDPTSIAKLSGCRTIETLWAESVSGSKLEKIKWFARESLWMFVNAVNFRILKGMHLFISPCRYTFSPQKRSAIKAYSDADIVISISGEALQDPYLKRIPFFLYGYWLAHTMGKIVAIFPQTIGPIKRKFTKFIVRYVLNQCNLVLPRDHSSLRTVKQLGVSEKKVYLVPDVAVNQSYISSDEAKQLLKVEGVKLDRRPLVGITISKWKELDHRKYFSVMKDLCRFITVELRGAVVLFSPNMPFREEISDWELAKALYEVLLDKECVTLLSKTYTPREFKGMLGEMDLFISTRMHAAVLATMIGTPTITIGTQPKLQGYMEMVHQEKRACEVAGFTVERAKKLIQDTLENSVQIQAGLEKARHELGERAAMASKLLREVYNRRRTDREE